MSNAELLEIVERFSKTVERCKREWAGRIHFSLNEQHDGALRLYFDNIAKTGQGDGRRFMEWLTKMADDKDVKLDLIAMADDPEFQQRLIAFYERHGFTRKGYQLLMTREPNTTALE